MTSADGAAPGLKILVTGGAGYVGSALIRDALAEDHQVRCLDLMVYGGKALVGFLNHPRFELVKGDVRDAETVRQVLQGVDGVVHLAAVVGDLPCQAAPVSTHQINYRGTELLVKAAKAMGIKRFVFASTCSNYGIVTPGEIADEDYPLRPVSLYAETKIDAERLVTGLASDGFTTTSLRFGTAFGTSFRTRFDLLVNSLAFEAWTQGKIDVFAANTWRPYIHVADMSRIMLAVLAAEPAAVGGQVFNAGFADQNMIKRDVVETLVSLMPSVKVRYVDSIDDRRDYRVAFQKLENALPVTSSRTVQDGFAELLQCFRLGVLTERDYEANKLESLREFFAKQEQDLKR